MQAAYGGRIGRVQASHAEGREFDSQSSQTRDLSNWYVWLASLDQGLGSSVLGYTEWEIRSWC